MTVPSSHPRLNRRALLKSLGLATGTIAAGSFISQGTATAQTAGTRRILGKVIDYSAGVPSARSVAAKGYLGAVRYVSRPRPDAPWMKGKPVTLHETIDYAENGLSVASVYQFGKGETADWKRGAAGAYDHAPQALALHGAAGGPTGVPIYVAIDDNPTRSDYDQLIAPYLRAFGAALTAAGLKVGVYGNYSVIDWCIQDGIGEYFWQHNWGSQGRIHPAIHLHQVRIDADSVDGIGVDINNVYASDWGQWTPHKAAQDVAEVLPGNVSVPLPTPGNTPPASPAPQGPEDPISSLIPQSSSFPDLDLGSAHVTGDQIREGLRLTEQIVAQLR